MPYSHLETTEALRWLAEHQGGDFHLDPSSSAYPSASTIYMSAVRAPANFVPFVISLYNIETGEARFPLNLMVNPTDIQYGHGKSVQNVYTRKGWVSTYWGSQLRTMTVSGSSAGFYYNPNQIISTVQGLGIAVGGLSNYNRKNSIAYANLLALVSYYKRNAAYFLSGVSDQTYWKDGTSRVINVMDFVMISYDGTDHLGGFNTFTLNDEATNPYRIEYNFEFVVAGIVGDKFDGHLRRENNDVNGKVEISVQGADMELTKTVTMNADELNQYFNVPRTPVSRSYEYEYGNVEAENEYVYSTDTPDSQTRSYYVDSNGVRHEVADVPDGTVRVTRGAHDSEGHDGKVDYRTGSGQIRALSSGVVSYVGMAGDGEYYVLVRTQAEVNGVMRDAYVRYYHLDPMTLGNLFVGTPVQAGSYLGSERYSGSNYAPHCDLEVRVINGGNPSWDNSSRIDASQYFYDGVDRLGSMSSFPDGSTTNDYQTEVHKHGKKRTAGE